MRARFLSPSAELRDWSFCRTAPDAVSSPGAELERLPFSSATVPGTVAAELAARGELDWSCPPALDDADYWYRCPLPECTEPGRHLLVFEGLAGLADVWLDDALVLRADNMFRVYELDVSRALTGSSRTLTLCFRALGPLLKSPRARPRWRTRLVDHQQLRWYRQALLGRTPGICPRIPPLGPYRAVRLEHRAYAFEPRVHWRSDVTANGEVSIELGLVLAPSATELPARGELVLDGDAAAATIELERTNAPTPRLQARARLTSPALWWPHTHGAQPLARARVRLWGEANAVELDLGRVGFRRIEREPGPGLALRVNGAPIFCRGACWSSDDLLGLGATRDPKATLTLVRSAGMNMLRVGGTMAYERDAFYDACDELGILLWQDFMFANLDYPGEDAQFCESVAEEARDVLSRLAGRPCLAVVCGSSEVEQQGAMLGQPAERWQTPLFYQLLPSIAADVAPDASYVPSTPSGGALPFHADAPVSHYYGVGAYLRPFSDVRASAVSFAAECLAFANVPEQTTIDSFLGDLETPPHHPRWKERVPRDRGVGWDFEDVRDHYVKELFGVDALTLRYSSVERYLALGRVASAEVMARVFAEWRRPGSTCRGGLVWLLNDVWPGAGFGVIDALGTPKSAYWALRRAFAPIALTITDEGLNGHALHAVNDTAEELDAELELSLYRGGRVKVAEARRELRVPARASVTLRADALLGTFRDTTFSYRFGPATADVAFARLLDRATKRALADAFAFPLGLDPAQHDDLGLDAELTNDGRLHVTSERAALFVALDVPGYLPSDNYFHLAPGQRRELVLTPRGEPKPPRGEVSALNASSSKPLRQPAA